MLSGSWVNGALWLDNRSDWLEMIGMCVQAVGYCSHGCQLLQWDWACSKAESKRLGNGMWIMSGLGIHCPPTVCFGGASKQDQS